MVPFLWRTLYIVSYLIVSRNCISSGPARLWPPSSVYSCIGLATISAQMTSAPTEKLHRRQKFNKEQDIALDANTICRRRVSVAGKLKAKVRAVVTVPFHDISSKLLKSDMHHTIIPMHCD